MSFLNGRFFPAYPVDTMSSSEDTGFSAAEAQVVGMFMENVLYGCVPFNNFGSRTGLMIFKYVSGYERNLISSLMHSARDLSHFVSTLHEDARLARWLFQEGASPKLANDPRHDHAPCVRDSQRLPQRSAESGRVYLLRRGSLRLV